MLLLFDITFLVLVIWLLLLLLCLRLGYCFVVDEFAFYLL